MKKQNLENITAEAMVGKILEKQSKRIQKLEDKKQHKEEMIKYHTEIKNVAKKFSVGKNQVKMREYFIKCNKESITYIEKESEVRIQVVEKLEKMLKVEV